MHLDLNVSREYLSSERQQMQSWKTQYQPTLVRFPNKR